MAWDGHRSTAPSQPIEAVRSPSWHCPVPDAEDRRRLVILKDQLGQAVADLERAASTTCPSRMTDALPRTREALRVVEFHLARISPAADGR